MQAVSELYDLGKPIDISKLVSSIDYFKNVRGAELAQATFDGFGFQVFPNGLLRVVYLDHEDPSACLPKVVAKIAQALVDMGKALGLGLDASAVLATHTKEEANAKHYSSLPAVKKGGVSYRLFPHIHLASLELKGAFATKRLMELVGSELGRCAVEQARPQSLDELLTALKKFFSEMKLGELECEKTKKGLFVARVYGCAYTACPQIGEPYCHLEKELLRSAVIHFMGAFNITVQETKCWGLGDTYCEFEASMLAK
ncbi:MAG: hypothetical protein KAW41_01480 [Candidatus Diapherotrites archaeon]|nr:hypothetical protein [Candidatus Diapherotrites archaeon]